MRKLHVTALCLLLTAGIPGGTLWLLGNAKASGTVNVLIVLAGLVLMGGLAALIGRVEPDRFVIEVNVLFATVVAIALLLVVAR